jgi:hypothetical protein
MAFSSTVSQSADVRAWAVALQALDRRLELAQSALQRTGGPSNEGSRLLREAEACLNELASVRPGTPMAARLSSLRDMLSSHLLAASTCERGELPEKLVIQFLRRGAARTRGGIKSTVNEELPQRALP